MLEVKIRSILGIKDWVRVSVRKGMNVEASIEKQETNSGQG